MAARQYRSTVEAKTLSSAISSSATSITLNSITRLPTSYPYTLVVDPDTTTEEILTVVSSAGGSVLNVTRGSDNTTAVGHSAGAVLKHMITARDLQEPQDHLTATSGVHGVTGSLAGTANPTFTGTVTLPTATSIGAVTSTEIAYLDGTTSAIQSQLDLKSALYPSTNAQTGTSYTLVLGDAGKYVEMNNASANVLTVPLNSSVAFPTGTEITIIQTGAGTTTITPTAGVTVDYYSLTGAATRTIKAQWAAASLVKRATDTWVLIGNLG